MKLTLKKIKLPVPNRLTSGLVFLIIGAVLLVMLGMILGNITPVKNNLSGALLFLGNSITDRPKQDLSPSQNVEISDQPNTTYTPTPAPSSISVSNVQQNPQTKTCQFNKEQMTALLKEYGFTDENINQFFIIKPGNCFNLKPRSVNDNSDEIDALNNKLQNLQNSLDFNCIRDGGVPSGGQCI